MTCRDILISELKRLGADGLICPKVYCDCHCTMDEYRFLCGYDDCIPAKLINGKWEAVEEKVEDKGCYTGDFTIEGNEFKHIIVSGKFEPMYYKEYCEWECIDINYYSTSCGCKIHIYEIITDKNTVCPVCNKRVREVK